MDFFFNFEQWTVCLISAAWSGIQPASSLPSVTWNVSAEAMWYFWRWLPERATAEVYLSKINQFSWKTFSPECIRPPLAFLLCKTQCLSHSWTAAVGKQSFFPATAMQWYEASLHSAAFVFLWSSREHQATYVDMELMKSLGSTAENIWYWSKLSSLPPCSTGFVRAALVWDRKQSATEHQEDCLCYLKPKYANFCLCIANQPWAWEGDSFLCELGGVTYEGLSLHILWPKKTCGKAVHLWQWLFSCSAVATHCGGGWFLYSLSPDLANLSSGGRMKWVMMTLLLSIWAGWFGKEYGTHIFHISCSSDDMWPCRVQTCCWACLEQWSCSITLRWYESTSCI